MDFKQLEIQGKTVIYIETESEINNEGWELWGKRVTEEREVFVYRKIVTLEEAEQYDLENDILS